MEMKSLKDAVGDYGTIDKHGGSVSISPSDDTTRILTDDQLAVSSAF